MLGLVLGAGSASSQPLSGAGRDAPLDISADSLEFEQALDVYVARGNVRIRQRGRTLTADWVAFNNTTRHGLASGNVVVVDAADTLYSDFLQFNVDTLQGVVYQGVLTNDRTGFRMEGDEVRKTGDETYEFENGLFTTCRCPEEGRDPWAIRAGTADLEVGGYAVTRNTKVDILGVPVLWLPWFVYPVKNERQSGFLLPTFTGGSRTGVELGLPYFWAVRDDVNLIFTPTYSAKRGFMAKLKLEYVMGDDDFGDWFASYIPSDEEVDPDDPETPFDDERWGIDLKHSQTLPWWDLELRALGRFVSDNEYPFDTREFSSYRRDRFLESVASLTKRFGPYGSFGAFSAVRWADDLQSPDDRDRDDFLLQRMPQLHLTQMARPLPWLSRVLTSFDVDYTHFWYRDDPTDELRQATVVDETFLDTGIDALPDGLERNDNGSIVTLDGRIIRPDGIVITAAEVLAADPTADLLAFDPDQHRDNGPPGPEGDGQFQEGEPLADKGHRLIVNPRLALPFRLGDGLEVYPELGYHGTFYQTDRKSFEQRSLVTGRIDLRSRLRKTIDLPLRLGTAEHVLEPQLSYYGVADLSDDDDNPLFVPATAVPQERIRQLALENVLRDPADRIRHLHGLVLGVSNRFYTLEPEPAVETDEPWVASRLFADLTASFEYRFTNTEFGWFVVDGHIYPTENLGVGLNFGYDLENTEISEGLLEFSWSSDVGHDLRLRYRYLRQIPRFFEDFEGSEDRFDDFEEGFNRVSQIELAARWAVTPNWALIYDITYSLEQSLFLTNRGGVEYLSKCKCWAIRVTLEDDRSAGFEFGIEYALLGLGDDTVRPFRGK